MREIMNKRNLLAIGLLFSIGAIFADGSVGTEQDFNNIQQDASTENPIHVDTKSPKGHRIQASLENYAQEAVEGLLSEPPAITPDQVLDGLEEEFAGHKETVFNQIVEILEGKFSDDDSKTIAKAAGVCALLEHQRDTILNQNKDEWVRVNQFLQFCKDGGSFLYFQK